MVDTPASIADDSVSAAGLVSHHTTIEEKRGIRTALQADQEREQDDGRGVLPVCVVRRVGVAQVEVREERAKQADGVRAPRQRCGKM